MLYYNCPKDKGATNMTLTIYDNKGLISSHYPQVNRIVVHNDGGFSVYHDWDGISFARDDYEAGEYSWYEIGDR